MIRGDEVRIHGTGETSRDFCYVANVVQANLLAATTTRKEAFGEAYNIAAVNALRCSSCSRRCAAGSRRITRDWPTPDPSTARSAPAT